MKIIIYGPPGSGKGTQANLISNYFNLKNLSSGNLLRNEITKRSEIGIKIKNLQKNGLLIPNIIIYTLIKYYIKNNKNIILDGFPRTLKQAIFLSSLDINIDYIINLKIKNSTILKRIKYRLIHPTSHKTYNIIYNPAMIKDKDDNTGDKLNNRDDDNLIAIKIRLNEYYKNNINILNWYKKYKNTVININSENKIKNIFKKIKKTLI